jgi:hypothetical protein
MPTDLSRVMDAAGLTQKAADTLRAARIHEHLDLWQEDNLERVVQALAALDRADQLLRSILGPNSLRHLPQVPTARPRAMRWPTFKPARRHSLTRLARPWAHPRSRRAKLSRSRMPSRISQHSTSRRRVWPAY